MNGREPDPREVYVDIIGLPHWDSPRHPRMSAEARAAQFAPYAALVGYGDMVAEEARETGRWVDPGEAEIEELNESLAGLSRLLAEGETPVCRISYFRPDEKKEGGETVTVTEKVRRIDPVRRKIVLARNAASGSPEEIDLDRVVRTDIRDEQKSDRGVTGA